MCRDANKRSAALFEPVERLVEKRKFKNAGSRLIRGERVQLRLVGDLRELDRPPDDARRIGKWLRIYEDGSRTVVDAGRDLKKTRVRSASAKLEAAEEVFAKSRRQVKGFGFRFCA